MCSQGLKLETPAARPGPAPSIGHQSTMDILRAVSSIHCHKSQSDEIDVDMSARRRLICASVLCLTFMLIELVGGILANSLAIATDAAHLLTDFASFMISLFSLWMGARPATKRLSFGWYRAEVIGALTSVIMIWAVTGVLVYMAIQRIVSKEYNIDATIMLISASVGVVVNIIFIIGATMVSSLFAAAAQCDSMGLALQIHPTGAMGHSHGSEESARRFELPSTEPFVPQGATASEMDSSRQFSHLDVFPNVRSRSALGSGSVNAMSPPYLSVSENAQGGGGAYSASAPSITSPPCYAHCPESEAAAQRKGATSPDAAAVDNALPQEDTAEQSPAGGTSGAQQAISSNPAESTAAVARSEAKECPEGGACGTVAGNAEAPPNSAAAAASIDDPGAMQHDLGTASDGRSDVGSLDNGGQQQAVGVATGGMSSLPLLSSEGGAVDLSPEPPMRKGARGVMNINVRAAFIHVLGDLIQSIGVLVAAIVIYFCPSCGVVDPVCTLMFSVIVLVTTLAILREALNVLMEGIPHSVDYHQVKRLLLSVEGVARVHDLHIWALSLDKLAVSAHVVLVPGADAISVRRNASRTIRRSVDVFKLTLQMEEFEEGIRQHCRRCSEPS